jgi:hypothetical protein
MTALPVSANDASRFTVNSRTPPGRSRPEASPQRPKRPLAAAERTATQQTL